MGLFLAFKYRKIFWAVNSGAATPMTDLMI